MKPTTVFFRFPPTWLALGALVAAAVFFLVWFPLTLVSVAAVAFLWVVAAPAWFFMATSSQNFVDFLKKLDYDPVRETLKKTLKTCSPEFQRVAGECLDLTAKILADFPQSGYQSDLELLVSQISVLATSHSTLFRRSRQYGTASQKAEMTATLDRQSAALSGYLETLKTFGGNLTLMDAQAEKPASPELAYINQGLGDLIQEMKKP